MGMGLLVTMTQDDTNDRQKLFQSSEKKRASSLERYHIGFYSSLLSVKNKVYILWALLCKVIDYVSYCECCLFIPYLMAYSEFNKAYNANEWMSVPRLWWKTVMVSKTHVRKVGSGRFSDCRGWNRHSLCTLSLLGRLEENDSAKRRSPGQISLLGPVSGWARATCVRDDGTVQGEDRCSA